MIIAHQPRTYLAHTFDMLRRRHTAGQRLQPLPDGKRDPMQTQIRPTTDPRTIMSIVNRGGSITREQFHIVWRAYADEEAREWLYRVGKAQSAGWPA